MDRPEVLKVVDREFLARPGAADRFLREIRAAARLQHPNIVAAYAAIQAGDLLAFAMEYVPGDDLAKVVRGLAKPLPVRTACLYARQVALGLQHAHEKGMVHRDIKPSNLMLLRDGAKHTVKVLDFGLAKPTGTADAPALGGGSNAPADAGLTGYGKMLGTPDYMAPEQWADAAAATIAVDLYSLGGTLYFLLTGLPPFQARSLAEMRKMHETVEPIPLTVRRPDVPAELAGVVGRLMAKDIRKRYPTPADAAQALVPFVTAPAGPVSRSATVPVAPRVPAAPSPVVPVPATQPPLPAATESLTQSLAPAPEESHDPGPAFSKDPLSVLADPPEPRTRRRKSRGPGRMLAAVVAGVVGLGLLIGLGVGGVFRVKTADGEIVLEGVPADAEVLVDGETVTVTRNGDTATVSAVPAGKHGLKVVRGGSVVWLSDGAVVVGGTPVRVRVDPKGPKAIAKIGETTSNGYKTKFLSEMAAYDTKVTDKFPRPGHTDTGVPIALLGELSPHAVFLHPKPDSFSNATFKLDRKWVTFSARVACINPGYDPATPQTFVVLGDGKEIWKSFPVTRKNQPQDCSISVAGVSELSLRVYCPGWNGYAWATWIEPQLSEEPLPPAAPSVPAADPSAHGFTPLFNDKDLTGWDMANPATIRWTNTNGTIRGANSGYRPGQGGSMFTTRRDYGEFHFRCEVLAGQVNGSWVFFRHNRTEAHGARRGYGVFNPGTSSKDVTDGWGIGSLSEDVFQVGMSKVAPAKVEALGIKPGDWYRLEIIARGDSVRVLVNGTQTVDHTATDPPARRGSIGFSCGMLTNVAFRNVEIKELPSIAPQKPTEVIPSVAGFAPLFNGRDL
ncbi:MAG: protein kinase domain-containing protein, partial [Fimbriiglobus sp.]